MSRILGLAELGQKLDDFQAHLVRITDERLESEVKRLQQETAALVPVDSGIGRAELLKPEAIRIGRSPVTGGKRFTFGFITPQMRKAAYYLFWVEFGTKGYSAGEKRRAGTSKSGRVRFRKVKRFIPARRAQPFFRPAVAAFIARLRTERALAKIFAAAATAAGHAKVKA